MPLNSERGRGRNEKPDWDPQALSLVARHLTDNLFTSKGLFKALQDELLVNTKIRTEIQRDLQHLQVSVNEIAQVLMKGNGQKPLVGQVASLQSEITALERRLADINKITDKSAEELFRAESRFEQGIETLRDSLTRQSENFLEILDEKLEALENRLEEKFRNKEQIEMIVKTGDEKRFDRFWSLFVELAPHILTWVSICGYVLYQWVAKNS
jgi:DNA repair exonuclease SbcCD ATPase subunit